MIGVKKSSGSVSCAAPTIKEKEMAETCQNHYKKIEKMERFYLEIKTVKSNVLGVEFFIKSRTSLHIKELWICTSHIVKFALQKE